VNESGGKYEIKDNAIEWEGQSNACYEYQCHNESGGMSWKRENATEWEDKSNVCYNYVCVNESGGKYELNDNATEWESQSNACYEYVCDNESGEAKSGRRNNATEWEDKSNGCYEYQCHNESGGIYWKECNSTDETERVCENDQCIIKKEEIYTVEIEVEGIDLTNLNMTEIRSTISNLTNIEVIKLRIRVVLNAKDEVITIIVIADDKATAEYIKNKINIAIDEGNPNVQQFKRAEVKVKELEISNGIMNKGMIIMIVIMTFLIHIQ